MILRPEPIDLPGVPPANNAAPGWLDTVTGWVASVPGWAWAGAVTGLLVATVIVMPVTRRRAYRAGQRHAAGANGSRRDRALLVAALTPAVLFWGAVLAGSFRGLVGFGRDTLRWTDGGEYLVPATLDGVAISFAVLAFRAIRKGHSPDRSVRIAWLASLAGAVINFLHEIGASGSALGGFYLGLMSILGMVIFDELLAQFEEGADQVNRKRPRFGIRWITYAPNTVCAALAWINHPPVEGTRATVANAVAHLEQVRADKAARRAARFTPAPTLTARLWPWARVAQLDAALTEQVRSGSAERAALTARAEQIIADHGAAVRRSERLAEDLARAVTEATSERARADQAEAAAGGLRAEHQQTLRKLEEDHAEALAEARAEGSTVRLADYRQRATAGADRGTKVKAGQRAPGKTRLSDEEAVRAMFDAHPDPTFEWSKSEVQRATGCGWERIPKLLELISELHRSRGGRGTSGAPSDDDKERAS